MKSYSPAVICLTLAVTAASCAPCTHIDSPDGDVPFGKEACSPDGKMYAREIEPRNHGHIGLFDKGTGRLIREVQVNYHPQGYPNPLKGLAWSPNSKRLAVMYHYDGGGHISVVNIDSGAEVKSIAISKYYHTMEFSSEDVIDAGSDTYRVE